MAKEVGRRSLGLGRELFGRGGGCYVHSRIHSESRETMVKAEIYSADPNELPQNAVSDGTSWMRRQRSGASPMRA